MEHCGYDDKLFVSEPSEYLRCGICCLVLRNPIQLLQCGHKYCSECFQRIKGLAERNDRNLRCPLDREVVDVSKIYEDVGLRRMVSNLPVRCSQADNGCPWTGALSDIDIHQEKCPFRGGGGAQAPMDNSWVMALVRGLSERIETCEHALVEKDKEISHLKLTINEMKTKQEDCTEKLRIEMKGLHDNEMKQFNAELDDLKKKNKNLEEGLASKQDCCNNIEKDLAGVAEKVETVIGRVDAVEEWKNNQDINNVVMKTHALEEKVEILQMKMEPTGCGMERASGAEPVNTDVLKPNKRNTDMQVFRHVADCNVIMDGNTVDFQKGRATVFLPDVVVNKGRKAWYEVKLLKIGIYDLNVGWCCNEGFSEDELLKGMGKNRFTYCFTTRSNDRFVIGHVANNHRRGKGVQINDFIGVAYDADKGQMLFSLNGQWNYPMGIAFEGIDTNIGFYPAISFNSGKIQVNYGEKDFSFGPPDGSYVKLTDMSDPLFSRTSVKRLFRCVGEFFKTPTTQV